jgi:uncharacterized membrane protein
LLRGVEHTFECGPPSTLEALGDGDFYLGAGFIHLQSPDTLLSIMPNWAPAPREVILITGVCEIAGALGLVTRSFRWWAAVMLALHAVCVFPANIKHAFENVQLPQLPSSWWYRGPRLALQPVIVWCALYCGNVIIWPFRAVSEILIAISGKGLTNLLAPRAGSRRYAKPPTP